MKRQIPAILLVIACAILATAYIRSNQRIKSLEEEIVRLKSLPAEDSAVLEIDPLSGDKVTGIERPAAAEPIAVSVPVETADEGEKPGSRRMMENISKMMDNPTMNKVMEASQRGTIGALYSDMIEYLNLNEEETRYFMDLLVYRQMKQVDMAMKMMSGQLSDEDKQALMKGVEEVQGIFTDELKKFLNNDEDFAEFEYYEKTMGERMMLSQLDNDLSGTGMELSDATYQDLVGMMHDERKNFPFTSDLQDQGNTDVSPERFSRENVQNYANDMENLNKIICAKAQGFLTPEQYAAFESTLKAFTELQLSQLEVASQMFGGGE